MGIRKRSRGKDVELGAAEPKAKAREASAHGHGQRGLLALSFACLGVIYGDIGTSPLYAFQSSFSKQPDRGTVLSTASLFFWTLTLIVLVKYVGVVLRFDDNGEGGQFALYSLICRAAGFGPYGAAQPVDMHFGGAAAAVLGLLPHGFRSGHCWSLRTPKVGGALRGWYRRSPGAQGALLVVVMLTTAMVVGDGVLTPSISVLSAISGLKVATSAISQPAIIGITVAILIFLFAVQRLGTGVISVVFAPVVATWLLFNTGVGFYNMATYGWGSWEAVNPARAVYAFTGPDGFKSGWVQLAGVMLCITGAEAMYADLGHFNANAVTLSFCAFVYPTLVITYMGQAAYLLAHPEAYTDPFWMSLPRPAFWPMLVVSTLATVVASQALISGVFSIMRQAMMLRLLPRMKITHTDASVEGQIYIGQVNYMLLIGCIAMVAGFQNTTAMGHAYGVAVMTVMFITTFLSALVMLVCFDINPVLVLLFLIVFIPLEGLYLSSTVVKIPEGGWVTLALAALVASVMMVWWYGTREKQGWLQARASANARLLRGIPSVDPDGHAAAPANGSLSEAPSSELGAASDGGAAPLRAVSSRSVPLRRAVSGTPGSARRGSGWRGFLPAQMSFGEEPIMRVPGLAIIYTQSTSGVPAVLARLLTSLPALPRVSVLLTLRPMPLPFVTDDERFMARRSRRVPGVYRVVARYGYMEEDIDHGPAFVRQLVACLVRHVTSKESGSGGAGAGDAAGTRANGAGAAANGNGAEAAGGAVGGGDPGPASGVSGRVELPTVMRGTTALAARERALSARAGGATAEGEGGGAPAPPERWSSVPVSPDGDAALDSVTGEIEEGSVDKVASLITRWTALASPGRASLDAAAAAADAPAPVPSSPAAASAPPARARVLGRESVNRREYRSLSAAYRQRRDGLAAGSPPADSLGSPSLTASSAGRAAGAVGPASGGGGGGGGALALSPGQVDEVGLLLDCYRERAVYVCGGTRVLKKKRGPCFNPLRVAALSAYQVIANNTQPATLAWKLPDEQLLEVTMTLRL